MLCFAVWTGVRIFACFKLDKNDNENKQRADNGIASLVSVQRMCQSDMSRVSCDFNAISDHILLIYFVTSRLS